MPRPRKVPLVPTADPEKLVANVLDEVKAVLRDAGVEIGLTVWIEAQTAAVALLPSKSNPTTTNPTSNGVSSNV